MRLSNGDVLFDWPLNQHIITAGWLYSDGSIHHALDFRSAVGNNTIPAEKGKVSLVQYWDGKTKTGMQSYGNLVIIDHELYDGMKLQTYYGHLNDIQVKQGEIVNEGQVFAHTGNSGNSTGPHLHFEVRLNGQRVNPLNWLDDDFTKAYSYVNLGTYTSVVRPKNEEEESTMDLKSDTFKIGPAGTNDKNSVKEVAASLGINSFSEGDYIVVGPMSGNDRTTIYNKAISLSLGCYDYVPSNSDGNSTDENTGNQTIDITPILEKLEKLENQITQGFEQSQKNYEVMESSIKLISDKLSAAGNAMQ